MCFCPCTSMTPQCRIGQTGQGMRRDVLASSCDWWDPPGAKGKSQPCRAYGDFLGLIHDLAEVQSGTIRFWSRAALIVKVADILALALQTGLDSGTAVKMYGVWNFLGRHVRESGARRPGSHQGQAV